MEGNRESVYVEYYFNTVKGPIVLEAPPTFPGFLDDMWERPVIDLIPPHSPTGRYMIAPPNWQGTVPEGFVIARPQTYASRMLLRGAVGKDGGTAETVTEIRKMRIYPLSEMGDESSRSLQIANISDSKIDHVPNDDLHHFGRLGQLIE